MQRPGALHYLRRFDREFLARYRRPMILALVGLLFQSLFLLPIPLLQGWVLDSILSAGRPPASVGTAWRIIILGLSAMVLCHVARMALAWTISATIGRMSQEVVVAIR